MDTVAGASACVQQMRGYLLNVISSRTANLSGNELLERTCSSGSSGLIIWPSESNDSIAELCILSARRFPVVTIDQNLHLDHVDSVVSDNAKGVNAAVSYMIEKGHRQIGFISNMAMNGVGSIRERYAGYCQALINHDIPVCLENCFHDFNSICNNHLPRLQGLFGGDVWPNSAELREFYKWMIDKLLNRPQPVTAVQCINDLIAAEFMNNAIALGVKVPQELSIMGFDNLNICDYVEVPLTTMRQDMFHIGYRAVEMLVRRIENNARQAESVVLPVDLIERQSVVSREDMDRTANAESVRCMEA